jgi:hypothetical protein
MILMAFVGVLLAVALPAWAKSRNSTRARYCVTNLRNIHSAKIQWAAESGKHDDDTPVAANIVPYLPGNLMPTCPAGGVYQIQKVSKFPVCSLSASGHALDKEPSAVCPAE